MLPLVIPGIIVASSMLVLFISIGIKPSLTAVMLGHTFLALPFSVSIMKSAFDDFDASLEEAAFDLGSGVVETFRRVTLPIVAPGIVASLLVTFTVSFDEFVLAFFLSGNQPTLPVYIWSQIPLSRETAKHVGIGVALAPGLCDFVDRGRIFPSPLLQIQHLRHVMTEKNIIQLQGIEKRFGKFAAVSNLDLDLREGEFFSLLGPSGCGKTTALRMIAGFQEPTAGKVIIDGQDMEGIPANRRPTNMVFQSYAIFPHLNVGNNVAYGLRNRGISKAEIDKRVSEALEMVELGGLQSRGATELSGGQRQRVALARSLVMRPKVLLLDEPLSALDKKLREQMQFEMRNLQQELGITFVMVTHDQYEAMTMSDRIGVMFDGRLVQVDTPTTLYAKPCNKEVASFIGEMNFLPAKVTAEHADGMTISTSCFGTMDIGRNPNVAQAGREIEVGIRPEQLEISAAKPEGYDATAQGKIRNVAFYGENVHYHVQVESIERPISASVPNYFHTVDFRAGDAVWLGVQGASVIDLGQNQSKT